MSTERLIKKYPNRRLYDTSQSKYITLNDVRDLVTKEIPFKVVDKQSDEDITRNILLQIIMEQESGIDSLFNADLLMQVIRNYSSANPNVFAWFMENSLATFQEHQNMISEHMQETLSGTPLDSWLKMSEQNLKAWNEMQQTILKNFTPSSKK